MTLDFLACESQFLDHAAPVWHATDPGIRGRFLVDAALLDRAARLGIAAEAIDADVIRASSRPPTASPGDGPMAFVASIGDTKIGRRLGYRRFAFMEHGAGQAYIGQAGPNGRNPSYPGGVDREDTELFLVPNEYSAALWRASYPDARVEVIGSPRLDSLPGRQLDPIAPGTTIAVSFHWPAYVCPEAGTAVGTFGPALASARAQVPRHRPRAPEGRLADAHEADLPAGRDRVRPRLRRRLPAGRPVRRRQQLDDVRVRRDRPPGGRPERTRLPPQRQPRPALLGRRARRVNADAPGDLAPSVERALEDGGDLFADREDALGIVYAYRTGAAPRAADALSEWVGTTVPRAA
jgi:hypothetical protein